MSLDLIPFGKSNILVTKLCIGTWQAHHHKHAWVTGSDSSVLQSIQKGLDCGLNFIDTALAYGDGHSEKIVANAIAGKRNQIVVATKFPYNKSHPNDVRTSLEQSLKNLSTDYIDIFQQHWSSKNIPLADTLEELIKLKEEGKIRAIGVSNWMEEEFLEAKDYLEHIDSLQPCYSLLWRHIEKKVLSLCNNNKIAILPYSPLCQGLLTGKYKEKGSLPKDSRRRNVLTSNETFPLLLEFLNTVEEIAKEYNQSPATVSLQWLLEKSEVASVITGASHPNHIDQNIKALDFSLSDSTIKLLNEKSAVFIESTKTYSSIWDWHPKDLS